MKKLTTIALLVAMLLTCLAGCGLKQGNVGAVAEAENVAGNGFQATEAGINGTLKTNLTDDAYKTDADATWAGTAGTKPEAVENVTTIETGPQLAAVMADIASYTADDKIVLANSIDLSGAAWTLSTATFKGTFDGQGNVIYGIKVTATAGSSGFFGTLADGAEVQNLGLVYQSFSAGSKATVGFLAAKATPSGDTDTTKVAVNNVYCYVNATNHGQTSGFIANPSATSGKFYIDNVTVEGSIVTNNNQTGALVGLLQADAVIKNCINNASVQSSGNYVGGIIAQCNTSGASGSVKIINCQNNGSVKNTATGSTATVGGIVGYWRSGNVIIEDCSNMGKITLASSYASKAGGIAGSKHADAAKSASFNILTSENQGVIEAGGTPHQIAPSHVNIVDCTPNGYTFTTPAVGDAGDETNKVVGYQTTAVADGKYNLRYVATLGEDAAKWAGFTVTVKYNDGAVETHTTINNKNAWADKAYTSINGGEKTYSASSFGAAYLYTLEIKGIPEAYTIENGKLEITITPITATEQSGTPIKGYTTYTHGSVSAS